MKSFLDVPSFIDLTKADQPFMVPYPTRFGQALDWRKQNSLAPVVKDKKRIGFLGIDYQGTFCYSSGQLFVTGRSGTGAIDDSKKITEFIYRNLHRITGIHFTLDTHLLYQIFHPTFWIDNNPNSPTHGQHPVGGETIITVTSVNGEDMRSDPKAPFWQVDPAVAALYGDSYTSLQRYAQHYVETLAQEGRYALMIWPFHAMLGGIEHALVSIIYEAAFFFGIARHSEVSFEIKGGNPLTEYYSILGPEVAETHTGKRFAQRNTIFLQHLLEYDYLVIAGQAKSHCVAWTIRDLLKDIQTQDPKLTEKIYLLEDCTSSVVIPGIVDFTDEANQTFEDFKAAGMHLVSSTEPIDSWEGIQL